MVGTLKNRYGARRNADIRWRGWLIAADEGEPVRAVHGGDIIYADWLRGQGLLMVVDHGEGWLSLYAQNHSLLEAWATVSVPGTSSPKQAPVAVARHPACILKFGTAANRSIPANGYAAETEPNNRVPLPAHRFEVSPSGQTHGRAFTLSRHRIAAHTLDLLRRSGAGP
ncbi:MAG: hypothetical protein CM15mP103_00460 [Gammaproteobacteria bacterium]|nr:MAG: hypothetical protein CM15mP103_00460 [Gammaproteobacteria bacterium]